MNMIKTIVSAGVLASTLAGFHSHASAEQYCWSDRIPSESTTDWSCGPVTGHLRSQYYSADMNTTLPFLKQAGHYAYVNLWCNDDGPVVVSDQSFSVNGITVPRVECADGIVTDAKGLIILE